MIEATKRIDSSGKHRMRAELLEVLQIQREDSEEEQDASGDPAGFAQDLTRRRMPRASVDATLADLARVLLRTGDRASDALLALLEDRNPGLARSLRAEPRDTPAPVRPFRIADGKPAPWRPQDLDWAAVTTALAAEGQR
jgi:hypothetical protein